MGTGAPDQSEGTRVRVRFGDLAREFAEFEGEYRTAVDRVLRRGWYILGEEVRAFERDFAAWLGARECVGCASGTDAITLALKALDIGAGDEVITVANTCGPTIVGIENAGARVRLVDADPQTLMLDTRQLGAALTAATRAIVPVHLYGGAVDMQAVLGFAAEHGLRVVEDCAQSHGSELRGRRTGSFGDISAFSFYPSKNLGAAGDGGACVTNDPELAERLRQLRNYGQATRYTHVTRGLNSRLDELQAALLRVKLPHVGQWNERRRVIARRYRAALQNVANLRIPEWPPEVRPVYHLFVILHATRSALQTHLTMAGIETYVHYPIPIHLQPAYADLGYRRGSFSVAEAVADELVSLPMYPSMSDGEVDQVIDAIRCFEPIDGDGGDA